MEYFVLLPAFRCWERFASVDFSNIVGFDLTKLFFDLFLIRYLCIAFEFEYIL